MKQMTPKERVLAFFHHQPTDALPDDEGIYIMTDPAAFWERPPFVQSGTDWFGVPWKRTESVKAVTPDHTVPPVLQDISSWREVIKFPDLEAHDWSKVEEIDHVSKIDRKNKVFEIMFVNGPFERLHMLMGFENALCAMISDEEEVKAFLDAFMEWKVRLMEKVIAHYQPDVLMFHDDWGTQNNLFFSPRTWRKLLKPQIQKAADRCHELGVIFEMHSCGKIEAIVPEFVEMGIDSWQGQEINNIKSLKSITGNRLSYHMTPDYQKYQAMELSGRLKEEEVRQCVRATLKENARGYCYYPRFSPFGGISRDILINEINSYGKIVYIADQEEQHGEI